MIAENSCCEFHEKDENIAMLFNEVLGPVLSDDSSQKHPCSIVLKALSYRAYRHSCYFKELAFALRLIGC